jgi:hypothetical protein
MRKDREIVRAVTVMGIEAFLGLAFGPKVLAVGIIAGVTYLVWTWDLMPHAGSALRLGLAGRDTGDTGEPQETRRSRGSVTLQSEQRAVSVSPTRGRSINRRRVRYAWEPKSDVSAHVDERGIHFARRNPSQQSEIYIQWELLEYDRNIDEAVPSHLLKP